MRKLQSILPLRWISDFIHSVRFRMTLWFALVLFLVLGVFSAFVYMRISQDIYNQAAGQIYIHLHDINAAMVRSTWIRNNLFAWGFPNASVSETFTLQEKEALVVSDPEGKVAGYWGAIDSSGAEQVIEKSSSYFSNENIGRFFSYRIVDVSSQNGRKVDYLFSLTPILTDNGVLGWMVLGQPLDPDGQLQKLIWTLALATAFTLFIALAGGYWLSDRALRPVKTITRTAQEISETDLTRRLNLNTRDELGALASTFDQMLDRLQAAFQRQRQFTADASHELRTPLTIIGLETSRALAVKQSAEQYQQALHVIQSESEFMTRLVSELLTLARMDAGSVQLRQEEVDLSDLTLEVVERYAQVALQKGILLKTGDLPELPIQGDPQFLVQMIGNLVDNAIKYSPAGANQWVLVETGISNEKELPAVWLRVSDNGSGIAAEHLPYIFDRFYRVDQARSHNPEESTVQEKIAGSGLGLSIVQWIAQRHGGDVKVQSELGQGTIFEVCIPLINKNYPPIA